MGDLRLATEASSCCALSRLTGRSPRRRRKSGGPTVTHGATSDEPSPLSALGSRRLERARGRHAAWSSLLRLDACCDNFLQARRHAIFQNFREQTSRCTDEPVAEIVPNTQPQRLALGTEPCDQGLEEQLGIRLLARTTRSVAPTDAGDQLIARLDPALTDIQDALGQIAGLRDRPAGRVRLVVSPLAATMVLAPKLGAFARAYPDVVLDVTTTNEMRLDLVAGHFDAGIHLGEFLERDMIAVRVSAAQRAAIVGAPAYFNAHPKPKSPRDLTNNRCLNFGHGTNETYRWGVR